MTRALRSAAFVVVTLLAAALTAVALRWTDTGGRPRLPDSVVLMTSDGSPDPTRSGSTGAVEIRPEPERLDSTTAPPDTPPTTPPPTTTSIPPAGAPATSPRPAPPPAADDNDDDDAGELGGDDDDDAVDDDDGDD